MRLIEEKDIERISVCIKPKKEDKFPQESYFKVTENNDNYLMEINYKSLPELETEILKLNENIDKTLLRNMVLTSVKARAKYERKLDEDLYEYAEEHKNDIPVFVYVF